MYDVGDKVRVKETSDDPDGGYSEHAGKEAEVVGIWGDGNYGVPYPYQLDLDDEAWFAGEELEPLDTGPVVG